MHCPNVKSFDGTPDIVENAPHPLVQNEKLQMGERPAS